MKRICFIFIFILLILACLAGCVHDNKKDEGENQMAVIPEEEFYGDGKGINTLVGVDSLGRVVSPSGAKKNDKKVGIFYWIWHGTYTNEIVDTTKIIEKYGLEYALKNVNEYNPNNVPHWWGEPLYGYYSSDDEYIIRKHLTLLMYSGVDFIMFDTSNTLTYPKTVKKICEIICEMRGEGFNVPQIAYYTHTASIQTVRQAYKEIYSKEQYREAWYCIDGKPLMVAQTDPVKDRERTTSQHAHLSSYNPKALDPEILDFFYFRTPAWCGMDPATDDGWPWIDWYYPPERYGNLMCISVASHHFTKFSWMGIDKKDRPTAAWNNGMIAWGRGYNVSTGENVEEDAVKGTFYQSAWDAAFESDPEIAYISGWNEWTCGVEYNSDYRTYETYDSFNMEYSRDAEMMKGGYGDNFLVETAVNARKFNYEESGIPDSIYRTVDISGDLSQWDSVPAKYFCTGSVNYGRSGYCADRKEKYTLEAAANSIQEVRIASDSENVYFYIRCDGDITTGGNKMNLFIGTGTPSLKGWNSYEYLLNREISGNTASVESLSENFNPVKTGHAEVVIKGNIMLLKVSRKTVGLEKTGAFYFKLCDSVEKTEDIMDYYVTGRCMPMGRFSYQYYGK